MSNVVWEMIPFASAVDVMSDAGKRVKQRDYLDQGVVPVIDQGEAFIGGYTNDDGMAYKGDLPVIIFGDHTRRIKLVTQPFAVGADGVKILKPKPFYRPKFFYYFLQSLNIPSRGYSRHFQFLRNFEFVKASTEVQDQVVAEIEKQFSRLDEAVASLKRIQSNLKRYKAAVLKAAVEGKLTEQWRKDHPIVEPADQLLKRILAERRAKWEAEELAKMKAKGLKPKDDSWKKKYKEPAGPDTANLPELPEGWVWATLDQLCPLFVDSPHRTPKYSEIGHPALRPRDVVNGILNINATARVSDEEYQIQTRRHLPVAGDVVYSRELSYGWAVELPLDQPVCLSQGMCIFRPHELVNKKYFMHFINGPAGRKQSEQAATGSAHPHINLGDIKAYYSALPPGTEQNIIAEEIDRRLSVTEELESTIETSLKRAERLRQTILQQAFSGGLV